MSGSLSLMSKLPPSLSLPISLSLPFSLPPPVSVSLSLSLSVSFSLSLSHTHIHSHVRASVVKTTSEPSSTRHSSCAVSIRSALALCHGHSPTQNIASSRRLGGMLDAQARLLPDLLQEVAPLLRGVNVLARALNNRLQTLPGE